MVPENQRPFHLFPFQVTDTAAAKVLKWPLPIGALEDAYGEEVQLFLHCHLRGYDKKGEGKQLHADFYDQYGAPVLKQESWLEGTEYITISVLIPPFPLPLKKCSARIFCSCFIHARVPYVRKRYSNYFRYDIFLRFLARNF